MMGLFPGLFARGEPALSEAGPRDAAAIAALHATSFHRGWSDGEIERMLQDRAVVAHRAVLAANPRMPEAKNNLAYALMLRGKNDDLSQAKRRKRYQRPASPA